MISRVAESCFWLHRYMERAENTARLLRVNRSFVLDVNVPSESRWRPVLVVTGEHERFPTLHPAEALDDGELVQAYLTWDEQNPASIMSSVRWARENARTIRETISLEMWETLNGFWHWISSRKSRKLFDSDRDAFYARIRDAAALFLGISRHTVLHDEPFAFMQLGVMLERAGQTARILDVKHRSLGPTGSIGDVPRQENAVEAANAMALLRSCAAIEPFFKRQSRTPTGRAVVGFLYGEPQFPRSILHTLSEAQETLSTIREYSQISGDRASSLALAALVESVTATRDRAVFVPHLHAELTRVVDATAEICAAIHADYFDPSFEPAAIVSQPSSQQQAQS